MIRYLLRVLATSAPDEPITVLWFDAQDITFAIRHAGQVVAGMDGPADRYGDLYAPDAISGGNEYYCTVDPDGYAR